MPLTNAQSTLVAEAVSISSAATAVQARFEVAIKKMIAVGIIQVDGSGVPTGVTIDDGAFVSQFADIDARDVFGAIKFYTLINAGIAGAIDANDPPRTLGQALLRLSTAAH